MPVVTHSGGESVNYQPKGSLYSRTWTYRTRALFVCVSSASAFPIRWANSGFHEAAEQTAAGKHAARVPPANTSPRAPLGPSLVYEVLGVETSKTGGAAYLDSRYSLGRDWHGLPEVLSCEERDLLFQSERSEDLLDSCAHLC